MKTIKSNTNYVEWLSADHIHEATKEWLSELSFLKDEHLFFEDLIKSNTLKLIEPKRFPQNKEIIDAINKSQKKNNQLIAAIKVHEKKLEIMVDGKDQLDLEEAYKKEHRALITEINEFEKNYKILKRELFGIIKNIKKQEKQKLLIERN